MNKKILIWIGIAVTVVIGIGIYFWMTKDTIVANNIPSSSIPAPPSLPKSN